MEKFITLRGGRKVKLDAAEDPAAAQSAVDQETKRADDAASSAASLQQLVTDLTAGIDALKKTAPAAVDPAAPPMPPPTEAGAEGMLDALKAKHPRAYAKHLAKTAQDHADARLVLGAQVALDGLSPEEIDRRVVEKQYGVKPETKLDAQFLRGMAAGAIESARKSATKADAADNAPAMHPAADQLERDLATRAEHVDAKSNETPAEDPMLTNIRKAREDARKRV